MAVGSPSCRATPLGANPKRTVPRGSARRSTGFPLPNALEADAGAAVPTPPVPPRLVLDDAASDAAASAAVTAAMSVAEMASQHTMGGSRFRLRVSVRVTALAPVVMRVGGSDFGQGEGVEGGGCCPAVAVLAAAAAASSSSSSSTISLAEAAAAAAATSAVDFSAEVGAAFLPCETDVTATATAAAILGGPFAALPPHPLGAALWGGGGAAAEDALK